MAITNYEAKYQVEYEKAIKRVYGDPRQTPEHRSRLVMEWILRLAFKDLNYLSDGDLQNLKYDVACFTENDNMRSLQPWIYGAPRNNEYENDNKIGKDEQDFWVDHLPTKDAIQKLIDTTKRHVNVFTITGFMSVKLPDVQIHVSTKGKTIWVKSHIDVFQYHLADMLAKYAPLIFRCPECKVISLAGRSNKQYCSVLCQSRVNMRKYRGEKKKADKEKRRVGHGKTKLKR